MKKVFKIIGIVLLVLIIGLIAAPFLFRGQLEELLKKSINENQPKSQSKIEQKSINNPSKIDQKSTKNCPKISLGGVSGSPWGLLAAQIDETRKRRELLDPLGAILGPSWGPLGAVLALGSPSWAVLGPS